MGDKVTLAERRNVELSSSVAKIAVVASNFLPYISSEKIKSSVCDFIPEELDDMLLAFMGSIKAKQPATTPLPETPPLALTDVPKMIGTFLEKLFTRRL